MLPGVETTDAEERMSFLIGPSKMVFFVFNLLKVTAYMSVDLITK